jgi:uncharacterized protein
MGKKDVLAILKQLKQNLQEAGVRVERMILYGSWAQGTATDLSDIDVVVISEDFQGKDYWDRINILTEAIYKIFAPIEACAMTPGEWKNKDSLICEFAREGETV